MKRWTKEEIEILKNHYGKIKVEEIVSLSILDRSYDSIILKAGKLGLNKMWTEEEKQILIDNYSKYTTTELHEKFFKNRTPDAIKLYGPKLGLKKDSWWTEEEINIIKENYGKVDIYQIVNQINRSRQAIVDKAIKLGLKGNASLANRKWTFDENYFDIPTLENCYIAGLLSSDGCVREETNIVTIALKDKQCVDFIKKAINFDGPIYEYNRYDSTVKYKRKYYYMSKITVHSEKYLDKLNTHWSITPRKSLTLQPPSSHITGDLALAYIIGYFDGDGCLSIRYKKNKYYEFSLIFCGNKDLLIWIKSVLDKLSPINKKETFVLKKKNANCYYLNYYNKRAQEIHAKLKEVPLSFRLPRKWDLEEYWKYKEYRKNRELTNVSK